MGVHCGIYKGSYNISNISYRNSPLHHSPLFHLPIQINLNPNFRTITVALQFLNLSQITLHGGNKEQQSWGYKTFPNSSLLVAAKVFIIPPQAGLRMKMRWTLKAQTAITPSTSAAAACL
jgi:hypothetical protein